MKVDYLPRARKALEVAPLAIRRSFFKQVRLLERDIRHPSLQAKKYNESEDLWQARINRNWRFYFNIVDDTYMIRDIIPHPKN